MEVYVVVFSSLPWKDKKWVYDIFISKVKSLLDATNNSISLVKISYQLIKISTILLWMNVVDSGACHK